MIGKRMFASLVIVLPLCVYGCSDDPEVTIADAGRPNFGIDSGKIDATVAKDATPEPEMDATPPPPPPPPPPMDAGKDVADTGPLADAKLDTGADTGADAPVDAATADAGD